MPCDSVWRIFSGRECCSSGRFQKFCAKSCGVRGNAPIG